MTTTAPSIWAKPHIPCCFFDNNNISRYPSPKSLPLCLPRRHACLHALHKRTNKHMSLDTRCRFIQSNMTRGFSVLFGSIRLRWRMSGCRCRMGSLGPLDEDHRHQRRNQCTFCRAHELVRFAVSLHRTARTFTCCDTDLGIRM